MIPFRKKEDVLFKIVRGKGTEWRWETTLKADQLHKMLGIVQDDIIQNVLKALEGKKGG